MRRLVAKLPECHKASMKNKREDYTSMQKCKTTYNSTRLPTKSHHSTKMDAQLSVVMVPFPVEVHIDPLLQLSCLITSQGIPVHYAGYGTFNNQAKSRLHDWDAEISRKIEFHDFQFPSFSSSPPNPEVVVSPYQAFFNLCSQLRQPVSELSQQLSSQYRRIIIIHDSLMASVVQDAKHLPNAECYDFHISSALMTFFSFWDEIPEKPFQLGSDIPIRIPSTEESFKPDFVSFVAEQHKLLDFQSGSLINTSRVIEGKFVHLLERLPMFANRKCFAIGPCGPMIMSNNTIEDRSHGCLEWLDKHEKDSVIYVAFGSTTSMTSEQIKELALGLERSDQRFLWVLKNSEKAHLPEGYEERVKDRGMVVSEWPPQLEILAHPSTGGFMTRCGWNFCMESISMGVPMAAWPMDTDDTTHVSLVGDVLRIGIVIRDWASRTDLVISTKIETVVRELMTSDEAKGLRTRAAELGEAVRETVAKGGGSPSEMMSFIAHVTT